MIAILGAMSEEVEALVGALDNVSHERGEVSAAHLGRLEGVDVVVAKTGVGKVLSALTAAEIINRYRPERIIFTGIAGSIEPGLKVGDLLVGEECLQYDFDVTALGFPVGAIPFSSFREIAADPLMLECMRLYETDQYGIHFGRILTGDTFVTDKHAPRRKALFDELGGSAVEMEGASVALTARVYGVPLLVLRFISDAADGEAPRNFDAFLAGCSARALEVLKFLLKNLPALS